MAGKQGYFPFFTFLGAKVIFLNRFNNILKILPLFVSHPLHLGAAKHFKLPKKC